MSQLIYLSLQGAIFANIGLTALQLPGINAVHWSARACCSSSMVLGVASVVTAAGQHRTVGMLNSPLDIRLWLSRGRPKSYRDFRDIPKNFKSYSDLLHIPKIFIKPFDINTDKYDHVRGFQRLPLESSISALKETALPRHLLDLAVLVFLVGFGLYVLFLWLFNVDESGQSYRNVFIVFVITVGIHVIYDSLVKLARILDDDIRNSEFNTNTWGGFRRREKLSALQQELAEVQERVKIEHPSGQKFQDLLFQRQQDHEDVMETEGQTSATTNAQSSPASVRNFNSPPPAPALAPATAALPAAKQDLSIPNSSTNRRISPACKVDKYQAWHHYLIGYMKTQAVSNEHSSLLKIMEIKGNFEAEWDLAIATIDQETQQATTPW